MREETSPEPGRGGAGRSGAAWSAVVDFHLATHEVDRHALPHVRDRILAALNGDGLGRGEATVTQLLKEDQQPPLAGQTRGRVSLLQEGRGRAKVAPRTEKALPRSA